MMDAEIGTLRSAPSPKLPLDRVAVIERDREAYTCLSDRYRSVFVR